jgi:transposase
MRVPVTGVSLSIQLQNRHGFGGHVERQLLFLKSNPLQLNGLEGIRLKDWRRIHTRYDRCAHTFFSAICIAAVVIFWINQ